MSFKACVILFIGLWDQIQCRNLDHNFNVDIPSYDEYTEWEPLPKFIFENDGTEKTNEKLSDVTIIPEETQEISNENEIESVFTILEEIKERLETIHEPLKVIKEHINEKKEPINETKKALSEEPLKGKVRKEYLEDAVRLEVLNEAMEDDGKDILESVCHTDEKPEKEVNFAGPVKAKGTVSIGANFGHDSSCPISHPYFPPFLYGPVYYPVPYYFPYLPPLDSHDSYHEFWRSYCGFPSKYNPYLDREFETLPDCNPEESNIVSDGSNSCKDEPKVGKSFGGYVPVNGRISVAAHF